MKKRDYTTYVAKTKALISFSVTVKLICVFVFAYAKVRFSHEVAHFRATSPEDMESKYVRVVTCSLLAVRKLLQCLPADQASTLTEQLKTLLKDPKFWKHGKHKVNMVVWIG